MLSLLFLLYRVNGQFWSVSSQRRRGCASTARRRSAILPPRHHRTVLRHRLRPLARGPALAHLSRLRRPPGHSKQLSQWGWEWICEGATPITRQYGVQPRGNPATRGASLGSGSGRLNLLSPAGVEGTGDVRLAARRPRAAATLSHDEPRTTQEPVLGMMTSRDTDDVMWWVTCSRDVTPELLQHLIALFIIGQ